MLAAAVRSFSALAMVACIVAPACAVAPARFIPLGDLPGGDFSSFASAVSDDGLTVVGDSTSDLGTDAFKWTEATGMVRLGTIPGIGVTQATSVSADGKVIAGYEYATINTYTDTSPFLFTSGSSFTTLAGCGCHGPSYKVTVSADGTTVIGSRLLVSGAVLAYRWTAQTGPLDLGDLPNGGSFNQAFDLTPDGNTVVGGGAVTGGSEGFKWTAQTGMVPLDSLMYAAYAVSADGSAIAGVGFHDHQQGTVRWTSQEGAVWLGNLPALQGTPEGGATDISADGSVIVGGSGGDYHFQAFRWTKNSGMLPVRSILEQLGSDMTGWFLQSASAVSADGSVIVGTGINPAGHTEGWLAIIPPSYVPEPAALSYIAIAFSILLHHRKSQRLRT
jgi:probable HAF family extracellular repeat protein